MTLADLATKLQQAHDAAQPADRWTMAAMEAVSAIESVLTAEGLAFLVHADGSFDVTLARNPNALTMREMLQKVADANKTR